MMLARPTVAIKPDGAAICSRSILTNVDLVVYHPPAAAARVGPTEHHACAPFRLDDTDRASRPGEAGPLRNVVAEQGEGVSAPLSDIFLKVQAGRL